MELVFIGKTKNVYKLSDGTVMLKLKDDATGKDGVFDPGENQVGLSIEGLGRESLKLSKFFFEKLNAAGLNTHYISCDIDNVTMHVRAAEVFGGGLEVVCRFKAFGSFIKRYGAYIEPGAALDALIEFTLKDDDRNDPPITKDSLIALNILTDKQFEEIKSLAQQISRIMSVILAEKGLELYDIKYEFGIIDGEIALIDELSGGSMRVFKDGKNVSPMEISQLLEI